MSSPTNILDDIAAKIDEEKQAVMAKYESKVHLYIQEAFHNAKAVDPQLLKINSCMGTAALYGKYEAVSGDLLEVHSSTLNWRSYSRNDWPRFHETRRLLDLLKTYDNLLPHELPGIGDIE
jgi:hypothetical protein